MGEVQAAVGFDRLPWLADEPQPRPPRQRWRAWRLWLALGLAALALMAGAFYWISTRGPDQGALSATAQRNRPPITVPLPAPREAPVLPRPEVAIEPVPQVEPVRLAPVPGASTAEAPAAPAAHRSRARVAHPARSKPARRTAPSVQPKPAKPPRPAPVAGLKVAGPSLWPVRAEQNSAGRLVRIGAFTTPHQAKLGWRKVMHFYPGMQRLPALVVPIQGVPSGRRYYRVQMGTTSQAHSEVLCQRMRMIRFSCVVLDIRPTVGTRR